jgi:Cytochrome oxidase complex assembly protein 1
MRTQLAALRLREQPHVSLLDRQQIRPLTFSIPRYDIRFPHGVPAFPISPPKVQSNRPLPAYKDVRPNTARNIVIFLSLCGAWTMAAFIAINYERFASPVTASTLHEVRKSQKAARLLGTNIQHRSMHPSYKGLYRYDGWFRQPWITGSIQLTKGTIDIAYNVKGSGRQL